jgi:hypothetical protein
MIIYFPSHKKSEANLLARMSAIILRIEHTIPYIQAARKKRVCVRSIAAYPEKNKIVNISCMIRLGKITVNTTYVELRLAAK